MKVKMYKAVDSLDSTTRLFAVRGNEMAAAFYRDKILWLNIDSFGNFDDWHSEPLDESRMINPILLWERREAPLLQRVMGSIMSKIEGAADNDLCEVEVTVDSEHIDMVTKELQALDYDLSLDGNNLKISW